jgi:hypothetical protein
MTIFDRARREGLLLFLFIPLVLVLLTRPPAVLGPAAALLLAIAIVALHRRIARPWALRQARTRSLWTGRTLPAGSAIELLVRSGREEIAFAVEDEASERRARAFLAFCCAHRIALGSGVFVPLLALAASVAAEGLAGAELFSHQRALTLVVFQGGVAATVLAAALLHGRDPGVRIDAAYSFPFPIHNLALVGVRNTLAVFVAVGCYWLGASIYRLATWPPL